MKISREIIINGNSQNTEYELTGIELERCYNEYIELHDRNEVIHQLKDLEYEDLDNIPEDIIADLASQVRDKLNTYMDDAVLKVIHDNEEKLEEYKEKWKSFYCEVTQTKTHGFYIKAKDKHEAEDLLQKYIERREDDVQDEFEYEIPDYETGWIDECNTDPENCDIKEEDM